MAGPTLTSQALEKNDFIRAKFCNSFLLSEAAKNPNLGA
jgi:hypothetical protein